MSELQARIEAELVERGGWLPFDRFMELALYAPGLGYYASSGRKFGLMPESGSDFVTAPELSPLFGQSLAVQAQQVLAACRARAASGGIAAGEVGIVEFGAGSGALAESLLQALEEDGDASTPYAIVDLSGALRARQQQRLARFGRRVRWLDRWPEAIHGFVLGNEVLDAMPVKLLHFDGSAWWERGVAQEACPGSPWAWRDRPTDLRPPVQDASFLPGTVTEIHPQAEAFIRSLADVLRLGAALFIDYGFPEAEYYLPQRLGGTLMCHRAHRADADPLADVGAKDITAHINFTGIALAGQEAGLKVAGYTSQARLLLNLGLAQRLETADLRARTMALRLVHEHEMGELFKAIAFTRQFDEVDVQGFALGDRTHRL